MYSSKVRLTFLWTGQPHCSFKTFLDCLPPAFIPVAPSHPQVLSFLMLSSPGLRTAALLRPFPGSIQISTFGLHSLCLLGTCISFNRLGYGLFTFPCCMGGKRPYHQEATQLRLSANFCCLLHVEEHLPACEISSCGVTVICNHISSLCTAACRWQPLLFKLDTNF